MGINISLSAFFVFAFACLEVLFGPFFTKVFLFQNWHPHTFYQLFGQSFTSREMDQKRRELK